MCHIQCYIKLKCAACVERLKELRTLLSNILLLVICDCFIGSIHSDLHLHNYIISYSHEFDLQSSFKTQSTSFWNWDGDVSGLQVVG